MYRRVGRAYPIFAPAPGRKCHAFAFYAMSHERVEWCVKHSVPEVYDGRIDSPAAKARRAGRRR